MGDIKHGVYRGAIPELRDQSALLRPHDDNPRLVWAQFDDVSLVWHGEYLGNGWHAFPTSDFALDPEPDTE